MPSPHIEKMPKGCVECHMAKTDNTETGGHTFKVSISTCMRCHKDVEKLISDKKAEIEKLKKEVENMFASLTHAFGLAFEVAKNKNSVSYKAAKLNYDLVKQDRGYGFHNFRYAKALLEYSLSLREELLNVSSEAEEGLKVSQIAPAFILKTLDGSKVVKSKDVFSEKELTVLIFWDSYCPDCLATLAECQKFYKDSEKLGVGVWSINFDKEENLPKVRNFLKGEGITFPILSDSRGVTVRKYKAEAYDFSFFIVDKSRVVRYVCYDHPPNVGEVIKEAVEKLLK